MRRFTDRLAKLEASHSNVTSRSRILFGHDDADLAAQRDAMIQQGRATDADQFMLVSWAASMNELMSHVAEHGKRLHDPDRAVVVGAPSVISASTA